MQRRTGKSDAHSAAFCGILLFQSLLGLSRSALCVAQAVLLHDGRVLAIGGVGPGNSFLTSTETYSEVDNIWTAAASLNSARVAATAVLLHDGKVLIIPVSSE